jgi:hypothetical protein
VIANIKRLYEHYHINELICFYELFKDQRKKTVMSITILESGLMLRSFAWSYSDGLAG